MPLELQSKLADSTNSFTASRIFLSREPWTNRASNILNWREYGDGGEERVSAHSEK